jgi:precorrin-2 dehydrogenase / sirohydrochlorin ferrochelatase
VLRLFLHLRVGIPGRKLSDMLPIVMRPHALPCLVQGCGEASERRRAMLQEAGFLLLHVEHDQVVSGDFALVFIADIELAQARVLAEAYRARGVLVNVEDVLPLCDFHTPSIIRRGDLLLTISSNAASPRLVRRMRRILERMIPAEWSGYVAELAAKRKTWKAEGFAFASMAVKTDAYLDEAGWLQQFCGCSVCICRDEIEP